MSATNYQEARIIDHAIGAQTFTPEATLYMGLFTAAPGETGGGTEVSGGSYARVAKTNNNTNFPNGNPKSNGTAITFPAPTGNWGTIVAWGLFDASTAGNLLYYGNVTPNVAVNSGDPAPSFSIGTWVFTAD